MAVRSDVFSFSKQVCGSRQDARQRMQDVLLQSGLRQRNLRPRRCLWTRLHDAARVAASDGLRYTDSQAMHAKRRRGIVKTSNSPTMHKNIS
jgi:hypothetical protein